MDESVPHRPAPAGRAQPLKPSPQRQLLRWIGAAAIAAVVLPAVVLIFVDRAQRIDLAGDQALRSVQGLAADMEQALAMAMLLADQAEARLQALPADQPAGEALAAATAAQTHLQAALPWRFTLRWVDAQGRTVAPTLAPGLGTLPGADGSSAAPLPPEAAPGGPAGASRGGAAGGAAGGGVGGGAAGVPPLRWQVLPVAAGADRLTLWHAVTDPSQRVAALALDFALPPLEGRLQQVASRHVAGGIARLWRLDARGALQAVVPVSGAATPGDPAAGLLEPELAARDRGWQPMRQASDIGLAGARSASLVAWQRLAGDVRGLVLGLQVDQEAVLATWRAVLPRRMALLGLLLGLGAVGMWRLDRALRAAEASHAALASSTAQLRTLGENLPDIVTRQDRNGRYLYANPAVRQALGVGPEALVGRTNEDLALAPEVVAQWQALRERVFTSGQPERLQFDFEGPQGLRTWESLVVPEPASRGEQATLLVISRDITERRAGEDQVRQLAAALEGRVAERTAQLQASEQRYRRIFEAVPVAIHEQDWSDARRLLNGLRQQGVTDPAAYFARHPEFVRQCLRAVRVLKVNHKAAALRRTAAVDGQPFTLEAVFDTPEGAGDFIGELLALWDGQRQHTWQRRQTLPDGSPLNLMLSMSLPSLDETTDGTALVCFIDITEVDRLNAELDSTLAHVRRVNRELETFTYSVSHDLKAPLRGIDGYSRLLLRDHAQQLDDEGRQFLGHIRRATQQMGQLIDDLLAYSRLERRNVELGSVALAPLAQSVAAACAAAASERGASVQLAVPPGLQARADARGLEIALRNLLDNALKFGRPGVALAIELGGAQREDGSVTLWVRDNGIGFDMRFHDRIFEIFQRLHRAEDYPGTGVGLAIVRKAMERMGGTAGAEGRPGEGAIFRLEIPGSR